MANLTNPVSDVARFAMQNSSRTIDLAGKQISTGKKGPDVVIDYVVGSRLQTSAVVVAAMSKTANYGVQMLKNMQSTLESVKNSLTQAKQAINQSRPLQGVALQNINTTYLQNIANVNRLLANASYDGRNLFDGSLINGAAAPVVDGIPANSAPIVLAMGEGAGNVFTISQKRLLPGVANAADGPADAYRNSVFPVNASALADKQAAVAELINLLVINNHAGGIGDTAANANGAIQGVGLPGNAIGDAIVNAAKAAAAAAAAAGIAAGFLADTLGAARVFQVAMTAALDAAAPYIGAEARSAIQTLVNVMPAAANSTEAQYDALINAVPLSGNRVGDAIITAAKGAVAGGANAGQHIEEKVVILTAAITQALTNVNANDCAYNLLTPANLGNAETAVDNALDTVTSEIARISGDLSNIENSIVDMNSTVQTLTEAADSYLNTNYEEAAKEFKTALLAMRGAISITSQGYRVAEAALALIEG